MPPKVLPNSKDVKNTFSGIKRTFTKGKISFLLATGGMFCICTTIGYYFLNIAGYIRDMGILGFLLIVAYVAVKSYELLTDEEGTVVQIIRRDYGIDADYKAHPDEIKKALLDMILDGKIGTSGKPQVNDVIKAIQDIDKLEL